MHSSSVAEVGEFTHVTTAGSGVTCQGFAKYVCAYACIMGCKPFGSSVVLPTYT